MLDISVCLCTFRRPVQLDQLLGRLAEQTLQPVEIVVVDNDPGHSAREVLQVWADRLPLRIVHQPEPNIALARNAAVGAAQAPWLALIDDDELPGADWLEQLARTQSAGGADGVMAPVVPTYTEATPAWMRQGGFFDRPRHASGTVIGLPDSRTGNVLLRAAMVRSLKPPFDPEFGRSGGEDTLFFAHLHRAGYRFVWCDEAVVSEEVPAQRSTTQWLLRRAYRGAQTYVRVSLHGVQGRRRLQRMLYLGGRALLQLALALLLALLSWPWSRVRAFNWWRTAAAQLGKLTALVGGRYLEYRS